MKHSRRNAVVLIAAATLGIGGIAPGAIAQTRYPDRPIKWIVPFPAAGTADVVARVIGAKMGERLGQTVVIDNRVGANGNIGTDAVAKAAPDGYTLLLGSTPNIAINPALYPKIPFNAQQDFIPVVALGSSANVLVVNPSVPARNLKEFLDYAKSQAQPIAFASGGNGSTGHLALEMLSDASKVTFFHVPYKGGPQAVTDLIGGQVKALFFPAPAVLAHVQSGRLKAIAVASAQRSSVMPDVPTIAESGFAGFDASPWFGLFVPKGTPQPAVDRLQEAALGALSADDVRREFARQGIEPMGDAGDAFKQRVARDLVRWGEAVKRSGVTID